MRLRYIAILLIICLLGLIAYSIKKKQMKKPVVPPDILMVSTVKPYAHAISENLTVTGQTIARDEVAVLTDLPNVRIKDIFVEVGNIVQKGQKLLVLDDEQLQIQLKSVEPELIRAKDALNRLEPLQGRGDVSEMSITEAKSSYQAALSRVEDARLALKRTVILAPEDGIIFERRATLGDFGKPNEPLFKIAKNNIIEVKLGVPEGCVNQISIGQYVQLKLPGHDKIIEGAIRIISPQIDVVTRVANVRVAFQGSQVVAFGSFVSGVIQLQTVKGFALPYTAIQRNQTGDFVWLVNSENIVKPQAVSVLLIQDQIAMVKEIDISLPIIAKAGSFVREGDAVKIMEKQP